MDATATHLNTIDLFMAVIIATIICSGARKGIVVEVFKLIGIFCTIFVSLHYYVRFADFLRIRFFGKGVSTEFLAFSILGLLVFVVFLLISNGWALILKIKFPQRIDRYGGVFLSLIRSYFACGLVFFALLLANHDYATPQARHSVCRYTFGYVAPDFYRAMHATLVEGLFPFEKRNEEALKLAIGKNKKIK